MCVCVCVHLYIYMCVCAGLRKNYFKKLTHLIMDLTNPKSAGWAGRMATQRRADIAVQI